VGGANHRYPFLDHRSHIGIDRTFNSETEVDAS